jgi:hypothetical protein
MAFDTQIQSLVGTTTDSELDQWMTDGVKEIVNILPPELKVKCGTFTLMNADANTTLDLDSIGQIIKVTREDADSGYYRPCREVSPAIGDLLNDSTSIHYATVGSPAYWIESNSNDFATLFVKPTPTNTQPAKAYHITYTTVDAGTDTTIANFPDEAEYLVVLYASCKVLHNKMNEKSGNLPSDLSVPIMAVISTSLPSYVVPTAFLMPPPPAGIDVDFSGVGTIESYVTPVFSSSVVETNLTNPTFTAPVMNPPDWNDTNTWITTEEDSEMNAARVQEINGKISEFSARMNEAQAKFSKENAILQKDLQISMQNYQGDLQGYGNDIQKETARISASVNDFQAKVSKTLQTYQSETGYDLSKYQAEIQAQSQKYTNDLQQNTSTFTNDLQKYTSEIQKVSTENQNILAKFGQELADYGAKIQKHSTDYQWLQGQYAVLKQDYNQGIQILIGGGNPPQQGGER